MKLSNLEEVSRYASALSRVRKAIDQITHTDNDGPVVETDRLLSRSVCRPAISITHEFSVPMTKQQAINVLTEQETYFVKRLEELNVVMD